MGSSVETTSRTARLALSRGDEREEKQESLAKVRQQALTLAEDPDTTLAVREPALSIAGHGGGTGGEGTEGVLGQPQVIEPG